MTKEEIEAERRAEALSLLHHSNIPSRYRMADTRTCQVEVGEYLEGLVAGRRRNLVLQGDVNTGKTYSACAVLKKYIASTLKSGSFVTFDDLLFGIRDSYGNHETERALIFSHTSKQLLVIDDFGKEQLTQWSLAIIWRIFNKRYNDQKPVIVTTQYTVDELVKRICGHGGDMQLAKAIVRRLVDPLVDGEDSRAMVVKTVGTYA